MKIICRYGVSFLIFVAFGWSVWAQDEALSAEEYEVIRIEDTRDYLNPRLVEALSSSQERVVFRAVQAMGRMTHSTYLPLLKEMSEHWHVGVRVAAAFALGQFKESSATQKLISDLSVERHPLVRGALFKSMGLSLQDESLLVLEEAILSHSESLTAKLGAAQGLGVLITYRRDLQISEEAKQGLLRLSVEPGRLGSVAAFSFSRLREQSSSIALNAILEAMESASTDLSRSLLLRSLAYQMEHPDAVDASLELLLNPLSSLVLKIESVRGLSRAAYSERIEEVLLGLLTSEEASEALKIEIINSLESLRANNRNVLEALNEVSLGQYAPWVRERSLLSFAELGAEEARESVELFLESDVSELRVAGIKGLAVLGSHIDRESLVEFLRSSSLREATAAAGVLEKAFPSSEQFSTDLFDSIRVGLHRGDLAMTYYLCEFLKTHRVTALAEELSLSYSLFQQAEDVEAKVAILDALAVIGSVRELPMLRRALTDPVRQVAEASAKAIFAISGEDLSDRLPPLVALDVETPSREFVQQAMQATVLLETSKGSVFLKMNGLAPLTAARFLELVDDGYYSRLKFHRVVPNFVVQGGDPRGDGFGGPGYFIRDEYSSLWHERGAVGIATAGKDTGGSQFFINHHSNLYLDGRYTVFAHVLRGMSVVDRLGQNDEILFIKRR